MRLHAWVPWVLVAGPVAVSVACWAPTEMELVITTDVDCAVGPKTAIFKGTPFEDAPVTETPACTKQGNGDATIGTLVLLPSGDRDGRAAVKVVLARGRSPSECAQAPADCIVATRSFSYVEHLSRRLPIRLLSACLGKICPDDQTCGPNGTCVSNVVTCVSDDCGLPEELPGADAGPPPTAPLDAGADGPDDGSIPTPRCAGPNGNGVLTQLTAQGMPGPQLSAFSNGTFFYVEYSGAQVLLRSTSTSGVVGAPLTSLDPLSTPVSVAVANGTWAFGYQPPPGAQPFNEVRYAGLTRPIGDDALNPLTAIAIGFGAAGPEVYAARRTSTWRSTLADTVELSGAAGGDRIALDATSVYVANDTGVSVLERASGQTIGKLTLEPEISGAKVVFAQHGNQVLAAGEVAGIRQIVSLAGPGAPVPIIVPNRSVVSLAVDQTHVYWTDGGTIWRTERVVSSVDAEVVVPEVPGELRDHLAVDDECLYYWSEPPGAIQSGVLRVAAKTPVGKR